MAPVRSYGNWHIRKSDQEPAVDPYCKYYFIAEGANTEKFYFEKLIDERKSLGFKDTIDIRFLEKTEEDQNISYPAHLIKFAERLKKTGEIEFDDKQDKMVVVFDADIFEKKVCNYQELLRDKSKSSIYAITNPAFEVKAKKILTRLHLRIQLCYLILVICMVVKEKNYGNLQGKNYISFWS